MLSAFTARPIVELKQRDKSRIESILAYGNRLLVGLNTGSLRIYRVNENHDEQDAAREASQANGDAGEDGGAAEAPAASKPRPVDLLREEEKFSKRPIQQLAIIKEANILVSLSDGYVSIHDLQTYTLTERLERTKGATSFAIESHIVYDASDEGSIPSIHSQLAVAVKRKIVFWRWQDMELEPEAREITLEATVKSLTWATGTKIVVGMDPGYVILDVDTEEVVDINKPGATGEASGQAGTRFGAINTTGMGYMPGMGSWVPKPMATKLAEGQMLLAKDVNTLFIDTDGKALEKRQIPWASAPEAVGYSYPYMLALQPATRGALEVRNPDTLNMLQSVKLENATILHVPQPGISLAHAGKSFLVASERVIWRMGAQNYESQIDELVAGGRYDEAISLLGMLEDTLLQDKEGRLREVKILKAQALFDSRRYREALDLFSDADAPPERVISLYPKVVAGDLSTIKEKEEVEEEKTSGEENGESSTNTSKATLNTSTGTASRSTLSIFRAEHRRVQSDTSSIKSFKNDSDNVSIRGGKHTETVQPDKPLEGRDLIKAVAELCSFLVQMRTRVIPRYLNQDGTLKQPLPPRSERQDDWKPPFYHLILTLPTEDETWEDRLRDVAISVDTTLFRAYMLARPNLAGPLFRLPNFCDPQVVKSKLYETGKYNDLIDFLHGKKLHREALELLQKFGKDEAEEDVGNALRGPHRTIGYLQQLPPELIDVTLEFAEWPIRADPEHGMEVFLADTRNAEELPRHKVVSFLERLDDKLAVRYLEHVVNELNDLTPDFHQRLIELYLEKLKSRSDSNPLGDFANDEDHTRWRERLQSFLKSSTQYNRMRIFRLLPSDNADYFESRAIVLSKMGQHKQALQIYVFQLQDYDKAEDYCNEVYLSTSPDSPKTPSAVAVEQRPADPEDAEPSIYHTLLSLYLTPPLPYQPNWPPALDLLSRHGSRLPASSTLSLIPASQPVASLESYFRGRIRSANSVTYQERIVAGLKSVEKSDLEAELMLGRNGRNRKVIIGEDRHCGVCGKRFGGSAIRVYPDGRVVHYGCAVALERGSSGQAMGFAGGFGGRRSSGWG